jgi:AraC-like DNA-binding protein
MATRKPAPRKPARKPVWADVAPSPPPVADPPPVVARRRGKAAYVPTPQDRRTVEAMIGVGIAQDDLAAVLGITVPTLHRHFRRELNVSYTKVVARMRVKLIAKAEAGDALCLIHVNKVLGWNDRLVVVDGGAEVLDPTTMSDDAIERRLGKLRRSAAVARAAKASGTVH